MPDNVNGIATPTSSSPEPTPHGHPLDEAASALQKSIRRGLEEETVYWLVQLDLGGYVQYAWRRLTVIACEDVGLADPMAIVQVVALRDAWRELAAKPGKAERIALVQAGLVLARAPKSRIVDHALVAYEEADDSGSVRPVPDWALDMHTRRGRQMGRGNSHFFDVAGLLADRKTGELTAEGALDDPFLERARQHYLEED